MCKQQQGLPLCSLKPSVQSGLPLCSQASPCAVRPPPVQSETLWLVRPPPVQSGLPLCSQDSPCAVWNPLYSQASPCAVRTPPVQSGLPPVQSGLPLCSQASPCAVWNPLCSLIWRIQFSSDKLCSDDQFVVGTLCYIFNMLNFLLIFLRSLLICWKPFP